MLSHTQSTHEHQHIHTDDPLCPIPLDAVGYISKLWKKNDLNVFFMRPHDLESEILEWASEWSKYSAILLHRTDSRDKSDIRVDFNEGTTLYLMVYIRLCITLFVQTSYTIIGSRCGTCT